MDEFKGNSLIPYIIMFNKKAMVEDFVPILDQLSQARNRIKGAYLSQNESLLSEYSGVHSRVLSRYISEYRNIVNHDLPLLHDAILMDERQHKKDGRLFNVFTLWNSFSGVSEPVHSRLIHFLLTNHKLHGQRNAFLYSFLHRIGVSNPQQGSWGVTAEAGRVDIMLKRTFPLSVVIIENKSNWAGDQPNQLYRYWYTHIYLHTRKSAQSFYEKESDCFKLIYLVPSEDKMPDEQTSLKPDRNSDFWGNISDLEYADLPPKIPIKIEQITFKNDISGWIDDCMSILDSDNYPLKEYLRQYQQFIKTL